MQLTSCERHSFDSNLGTISSHRGAVPFHAIVLINNSPQDVIQTRIQQYSFLKNTAILTCFSCPAALLLFSEKRQPRRQVLRPLCSAQLSWLKPQGSLYSAVDSLALKFGALCDNLFIYSMVLHLNFSMEIVFFQSCFSVEYLWFCCMSWFIIKDPSSVQGRYCTHVALFDFLSHELTSALSQILQIAQNSPPPPS